MAQPVERLAVLDDIDDLLGHAGPARRPLMGRPLELAVELPRGSQHCQLALVAGDPGVVADIAAHVLQARGKDGAVQAHPARPLEPDIGVGIGIDETVEHGQSLAFQILAPGKRNPAAGIGVDVARFDLIVHVLLPPVSSQGAGPLPRSRPAAQCGGTGPA